VDAQQCVKLTGTNRSFDLIALVAKARDERTDDGDQGTDSLLGSPVSLLKKISFASFRRQTSENRPENKAFRPPFSVLRPPISVLRFLPAWWLLQGAKDPIPSRTRPSNALAPMVLCLKTWESRPSPGLQRTDDGDRRTDPGEQRTENREQKVLEVPSTSLKSSSQQLSTLPRPKSGGSERSRSSERRTVGQPQLFFVPLPASDRRGVEQPGSSSGS
jgi:hypothetical protein